MNSKFVKFIRDYLVYFLFISLIFISYIYTFSNYFHPRSAIEDIAKLSDKNHECYFENNDLPDNSAPSEESNDSNAYNTNDFVNSKNKKGGNYNTYNTFFELNDVIIYQFKKAVKKNIYTQLLSLQRLSVLICTPTFNKKLICSQDAYYILERQMRL